MKTTKIIAAVTCFLVGLAFLSVFILPSFSISDFSKLGYILFAGAGLFFIAVGIAATIGISWENMNASEISRATFSFLIGLVILSLLFIPTIPKSIIMYVLCSVVGIGYIIKGTIKIKKALKRQNTKIRDLKC